MYDSSEFMLAFDLVINTIEEIGDGYVIPNLYELDADLILVCSKFVEVFGCVNDHLLYVLERTLWSTVGENDQIESWEGVSLTSIERLECFDILLKVSFQVLIGRGISSWGQTSKVLQLIDTWNVLLALWRIEEVHV